MELSGTGVGSWAAAACSSSMLLREFQEPAGNIPILGAAVPPVKSGTKSVRTPHAAAPRAKAPVEVQTSTAGSRRQRRGAGMRSLLPHPHPHPTRRRRGRTAPRGGGGETRCGVRRGTPTNRSAPLLNIWIILFFFNLIEPNPKLSKANGYPYPT